MAVNELELKDLTGEIASGNNILSANVDVIKDLKVSLNVILGESSLRVDELMSLKEGSIVKVNKKANADLDIYIKDKLVARGVMVVVDDNFGIKVTEINS